jgi:hypothetical protein
VGTAGWGGWGIAGGVAGLVATLAMGVAFIALMTGAAWALRVCRVFAAAAPIVSAAGLARGLRIAAESTEWRLPAGRVFELLLETVLELHVMLPLGSFLLCILIAWFLFGTASRRFFNEGGSQSR